ncbi:MAG: hypothetical protein RMM29_01700 [Planctomycetota bacterium]|nr:hypothetical protein [Planctomycetota bacterium]
MRRFLSLTLCAAAACAGEPAIPNGSMTEGGDTPTGWSETYTMKGRVVVARDTEVFASAPASLRLESLAGEAVGNVNAFISDASGTFTVSGKVRSQGLKRTVVAVMGFDQTWQMKQWVDLYETKADVDWTSFSKPVSIDPAVKHVKLCLMIEGDGKAWIDDVEVKR